MPTDDELLVRVQHRATAIRRRQRLLVAGVALAVVAVLAGGVVAGSRTTDRDPVDVAADPAVTPDPATTTTGDAEGCVATDSPAASADGDGPAVSAGPSPAPGGSAGLPTVTASTETCAIRVGVVATYDPVHHAVSLDVAMVVSPLHDAYGVVGWDAGDPARTDLGDVRRDQTACDALAEGAGPTARPARSTTATAAHLYPDGGDKEVVVHVWIRRCEGPADRVAVTVTVPL
ncbi:MAG TPA: hypothetical protein VFU19_16965 [Iamia sp.]|nr:hypothetical protein [Iamia sp.]